MTIDDLPILAVCGSAGSGKTTLIESLVLKLTGEGLKVAVVKHAAGRIQVDRPGKDSDRLFAAGADVLSQGRDQQFLRTRRVEGPGALADVLHSLAAGCDLVLVEGYKRTSLRKLWLLAEDESAPPGEVANIAAVLDRNRDRPADALPLVRDFLQRQWTGTPVFGCVLIGGASRRMGRPKHLLRKGPETYLQRTVRLLGHVSQQVVIAGGGEVPDQVPPCIRLADVPDARGPLAGLLAAMRWAPGVSWLVAACDLPDLSADALNWLLASRSPGVWATLPRLTDDGRVEPLLAHYDFRSKAALQQQAADGNFRLSDLHVHPKMITPTVPAEIVSAWKNVNRPADLNNPSPAQ